MERKELGLCDICNGALGLGALEKDNYFFCSRTCYDAYLAIKFKDGSVAKDTQVGGDHYKKMGKYQPWQVAAEWLTPEELRG